MQGRIESQGKLRSIDPATHFAGTLRQELSMMLAQQKASQTHDLACLRSNASVIIRAAGPTGSLEATSIGGVRLPAELASAIAQARGTDDDLVETVRGAIDRGSRGGVRPSRPASLNSAANVRPHTVGCPRQSYSPFREFPK